MNIRAKGRTTRMLVGALKSFLAGNNVLIVGYSFKYARELKDKLTDSLNAFGVTNHFKIDGKSITSPNNKLTVTGYERYIDNRHQFDAKYDVFVDHYCSEHYWENKG